MKTSEKIEEARQEVQTTYDLETNQIANAIYASLTQAQLMAKHLEDNE